MLHDAEVFKSKLGKVEGASALADHLIKIISDRPVPDENSASLSPPSKVEQPLSTTDGRE